jgi:ATP-binding cassette subfamily F protein uup
MNNSPILSLRNITISFAKKIIFENLNLNLFSNDRVCLIGKNGVGKSTLMNCIANLIDLDFGERWIAPNIILGHLTQSEKIRENISIFDFIKQGIKLDDHKEYLIDIICDKLKLDKNQNTSNLSGGQKRRANLAKSLILEPDILLLDEPTNHLDLEIIEWLENYLLNFKGSLVIISHDRKFLEKVSNKVFWIRAGNFKINNQGYKNFDEWSQNIIDHESRELENLQKKVELESGWLQTGVTARRKRNIGRLHHLNELKNKLAIQQKLVRQNQNNIKIITQKIDEDAPQVIMSFNNVSFALNEKILIKDFNYKILRGERIGIIGNNGIGKSSLLRLMTKQLSPTQGTVKMAKDIDFSYFDQSRSAIKKDSTIQEILCESGGDFVKLSNGKTKHICGYLKDFLFDPKETQTLAGTLSGGQQNRLLLAKTLASPGNFMILDEPTNDLDMDSLDILEKYLEEYQGTLVVVSHDRDFLDNIATTILGFEGDGIINYNIGGFSDYIKLYPRQNNLKNEQQQNILAFTKSKNFNENTKKINYQKLDNKLKNELAKLPEKIARIQQKLIDLESEKSKLDDISSHDLIHINIEIANQQYELEKLEDRWLELEYLDSK